MSIAALLEAADFLERREREAEHGYAIVSVVPQQSRRPENKLKVNKHAKTRKSLSHRSTHNELEKNRRAHLRRCLERLREEVPPGPDASRHTTLGLLTRARDFIRHLQEKDRMNYRYKNQLSREHRLLAERLAALTPSWRTPKLRASDSCGSASDWSSVSSGYSTSETADSDELESRRSLSPGSGSSSGSDGSEGLDGADGGREEAESATFGIGALAVAAGRSLLA